MMKKTKSVSKYKYGGKTGMTCSSKGKAKKMKVGGTTGKMRGTGCATRGTSYSGPMG